MDRRIHDYLSPHLGRIAYKQTLSLISHRCYRIEAYLYKYPHRYAYEYACNLLVPTNP